MATSEPEFAFSLSEQKEIQRVLTPHYGGRVPPSLDGLLYYWEKLTNRVTQPAIWMPEYSNELMARDSIQVILESVPPELAGKVHKAIQDLDLRFIADTKPYDWPILCQAKSRNPWFYFRIPTQERWMHAFIEESEGHRRKASWVEKIDLLRREKAIQQPKCGGE